VIARPHMIAHESDDPPVPPDDHTRGSPGQVALNNLTGGGAARIANNRLAMWPRRGVGKTGHDRDRRPVTVQTHGLMRRSPLMRENHAMRERRKPAKAMSAAEELRLMLMVLALVLAACTRIPNPYPGQPWVGPDGRVVQPPPEGWPDYARGGRGF
jgi:hypothetical protein